MYSFSSFKHWKLSTIQDSNGFGKNSIHFLKLILFLVERISQIFQIWWLKTRQIILKNSNSSWSYLLQYLWGVSEMREVSSNAKRSNRVPEGLFRNNVQLYRYWKCSLLSILSKYTFTGMLNFWYDFFFFMIVWKSQCFEFESQEIRKHFEILKFSTTPYFIPNSFLFGRNII